MAISAWRSFTSSKKSVQRKVTLYSLNKDLQRRRRLNTSWGGEEIVEDEQREAEPVKLRIGGMNARLS